MKKFFSQYIFILIPFVVLITTKGVISDFQGVLSATDWSIASFMVIAQSMSFILISCYDHPKISKSGISIFLGLTLILLIVCIGIYAYSLVHPDGYVANSQPIVFLLSSLWMAGVFKAKDYLALLK